LDKDTASRDVGAVLRRYAAAYEAKNIDAVVSEYPSLSGRKRHMVGNLFFDASVIEIELAMEQPLQFLHSDLPAAQSEPADIAVVRCRRRMNVVYVQGNKSVTNDHVTVRLHRSGTDWKIVSID
jgi:hypothetical protein